MGLPKILVLGEGEDMPVGVKMEGECGESSSPARVVSWDAEYKGGLVF